MKTCLFRSYSRLSKFLSAHVHYYQRTVVQRNSDCKKDSFKKNLFYPSRKCDAHSLELKYPRSCRSFLNHGYSKSCLMSCWELPTFCIEISAAAARGGGLGSKHFSGPPINGRFPAALKWRCQNAPRGSFINWAIPKIYSVAKLRINKALSM